MEKFSGRYIFDTVPEEGSLLTVYKALDIRNNNEKVTVSFLSKEAVNRYAITGGITEAKNSIDRRLRGVDEFKDSIIRNVRPSANLQAARDKVPGDALQWCGNPPEDETTLPAVKRK